MSNTAFIDRLTYDDLNQRSKSFQGSANLQGYAVSMDSDTVFHSFLRYPKVVPQGIPIFCEYHFFNSEIELKRKLQELNSSLTSKALIFFCLKLDYNLKVQCFFYSGADLIECGIKVIPGKTELYSRSKGLLEVSLLETKTVAIVGLGSGGSPLALELAKAGVGNFILIDFDRLELSNISRHICGLGDLGRFKTFAVRDLILGKNPYANIETFEVDVNLEMEVCQMALSKADLILCASDNDRSRFFINDIALKNRIPAIFGRAITRATGGDILRVRPFVGPCYNCLYSQNIRSQGGDDEEISQEQQALKLLPDYTSPNEIESIIQVGLASDIAPISNLMVKLALVELSKGLESGISSLEQDLVADFYIWANRREGVYESWDKLEYNFNKPSILRWYGARVSRDLNCMACSF